MSRLTIVFGVLLLIVGVCGWAMTGANHPTALIPAGIGVLLMIFGGLAVRPERRALFMHIAVTLGLLGFLMTIPGLIDLIRMARGVAFPHPIAVEEKAATCVLCLIFTALCVRSFIEARRNRVAAV